MNPLISIITPAYNAEVFIAETIDSVISQTYKNWEYIIVDDCSKDSTAKIIQEYIMIDSRIKYYKLISNSGNQCTPRNFGLEKAKGEYIAFIDHDDIWLPKKLEIQLETLNRLNSDLVYTNSVYFYPNGEEFFLKTYLVPSFFSLLMRDCIPISSVLVKNSKELYFNPAFKFSPDHLLLLELHKNGFKFSFVNEFLTRYRYNSNSLLHGNPRKALFDGYKVIITIAKKYNYNFLFVILAIIAQTIMRGGNVMVGIIKRRTIQYYRKIIRIF